MNWIIECCCFLFQNFRSTHCFICYMPKLLQYCISMLFDLDVFLELDVLPCPFSWYTSWSMTRKWRIWIMSFVQFLHCLYWNCYLSSLHLFTALFFPVQLTMSIMLWLVPSSQAMTFFRELVAYYTLLESGVDSGPSANGKTTYNAVNSIDNQQDKASSFGGMGFDPHMFATNIPSSCSIYGNMVRFNIISALFCNRFCDYCISAISRAAL